MSLLDLLKEEAGPEHPRIIIAAIVAGVSNSLLLATLNSIVQSPAAAGVGSLFLYAVCLVTFVLNTRYTTHRITELVESILHRTKVRIGEKLVRAELEALEKVHAAEICARITDNATIITDRVGKIATTLQSAFLVVFAVAYVAYMSPAAFAAILIVCAVGSVKFLEVRRQLATVTQKAAGDRVTFLERMTDLLAGIKEIQFGKRRRRDVHENIIEASDALRASAVRINDTFMDGVLVANAILFCILAAVIYTLQQYMVLDARQMISVVSAVLFLWGPFMGFVWGLVPYVRSDFALQEILALETKLDQAAREGAPTPNPPDPWTSIQTIEMQDVEYEYGGDEALDAFRVGPVNLRINAGEVVFIVGGNGSGKSTLLKVLTGLYVPTQGALLVDGTPVRRDNVVAYRRRISAIFADYHLFPKLYGTTNADERGIAELLTRMHLDGQTAFVDRVFTKLDLSTGQKKRLALVIALLEDRPICAFDEWAADQDPEFRRYFYDELLPALRAQGKTVLVVSHDDRYFHCADQVVTMEYGRIRSIDKPATKAVVA